MSEGVGVLVITGTPTAALLGEALGAAAAETFAAGRSRLEIRLDGGSRAGRRALHVAGFRFEGVCRNAGAAPDGTPIDLAQYSLLPGDHTGGPVGWSSVMDSVLPRKRCIAHVLMHTAAGHVAVLRTSFKDDYELPGGIVEDLESPYEGAIREVREELGVTVQPGPILVVDWLRPYLGWSDAIEIVYDGGQIAEGTELRPDGHEILSLHWLLPEEAAAVMTPFGHARLMSAVRALRDGMTLYTEGGVPTA